MSTIDSKAKALAQVKRFIDSEKRIPQLPQILLRVEAALENPEVGGEELVRVILDDPALTAQVLKIANSTFYNPRGSKITTISRAIVILGFDNIRRLVLGLSVSRMFTLLPRWSVYRRLWRHSLATALLARGLARVDAYKETEAAFVGGLLHDVGTAVIPDKLIYKQKKLGEEEIKIFRERPKISYRILHKIGFYTSPAQCGIR